MRRTILIAVLAVALMAPACAFAGTSSASAGGVEATLSWSGGPGITTKDERLTISQNGKVVYDEKVSRQGCVKTCVPGDKHPVHIADLYADGGEDVILDLFSGGADCCTIEQVYVPSAAVNSYVLDEYNFGEAAAGLEDIGPKGRPLFVSANKVFYCEFTDCAASGLPLQIFEFNAEKFVDITKRYPKLIKADAARWLSLYYKNHYTGEGLIAAWAADEYNLGRAATARALLALQVHQGVLKAVFVDTLEHFLTAHGY